MCYKSYSTAVTHGSAVGYGRKVTASKGWQPVALAAEGAVSAENTSIYVTWEAPGNLPDGSVYTVYRRKEGETSWTERSKGCTGLYYEDTGADPGVVYEYCVGITGSVLQPDDDNAFIAESADIMDAVVLSEKQIAGYILPPSEISSVSRSAKFGTSEQVNWVATGADSSTSNRGVDGYAVEVLNLNISDTWHIVGEYMLGTDLSAGSSTYTQLISSDVYLKVLRDYKHYFRVRPFVRRDGQTTYAKTPDYEWADGKEDEHYVKWGARKLTDEEFARMALLVFSDGFWRFNNGAKLEESKTVTTAYGTLSLTHKTTLSLGKEYQYSMSEYKPDLATPAGVYADIGTNRYCVAPLVVSAESSAYRDQLGIAGFAKSFDSVDIAVALNGFATEMSGLAASYIGTVTMSSATASSIALSVTRFGGTAALSVSGDRRSWLPIRFHDDSEWFFYNSDYGWWPAAGDQ